MPSILLATPGLAKRPQTILVEWLIGTCRAALLWVMGGNFPLQFGVLRPRLARGLPFFPSARLIFCDDSGRVLASYGPVLSVNGPVILSTFCFNSRNQVRSTGLQLRREGFRRHR